jgi:hypothetical protein
MDVFDDSMGMYAQLSQMARSMQSQLGSDLDSDRLLRVLTELATQILHGVRTETVRLGRDG